VTLMRFEPFRELDRLAERTMSAGARALHSMPMEALRRGERAASGRPGFRRPLLRRPERRRRFRARPGGSSRCHRAGPRLIRK
jgi:hypothetical protein